MPLWSCMWQRSPGELGLGGSRPRLLGRPWPAGTLATPVVLLGTGQECRDAAAAPGWAPWCSSPSSCCVYVCLQPVWRAAACAKTVPVWAGPHVWEMGQKASGFLGAGSGPGEPRVFAGKPQTLLGKGALWVWGSAQWQEVTSSESAVLGQNPSWECGTSANFLQC